MEVEFSRQIFEEKKNPQIRNLMKIREGGSRGVPDRDRQKDIRRDRQKDMRDDTNSRFSQFARIRAVF